MGVRETLNKQKWVGAAFAAVLILAAGGLVTYTEWPQHHFSGKTAFYTDDEGQTWFIDSVYKTTPFDHDGKQAVRAVIYSYEHGGKQFCAYLMRDNPSDKKRLDDAVATAAAAGKPPSSVDLFENQGILNNMQIKQLGPGHPWVPILGPDGSNVTTVGLESHDDGTLDIVYAE
jgi:hypothetical protein